jgi:hypothetical protein
MRRKDFAVVGIIATIAGCAGGSQLVTGPDLLTYTATSQVTSNNPMRFSTTVTVTNGTTEAISFLPVCPIPRTLVYSNTARTGTPLWDSNSRIPAINCATPTTVTLGAGKSVTYTLTATGSEALGAAGIAGTYYLMDEVTLSGVVTQISAGQVNLAR